MKQREDRLLYDINTIFYHFILVHVLKVKMTF